MAHSQLLNRFEILVTCNYLVSEPIHQGNREGIWRRKTPMGFILGGVFPECLVQVFEDEDTSILDTADSFVGNLSSQCPHCQIIHLECIHGVDCKIYQFLLQNVVSGIINLRLYDTKKNILFVKSYTAGRGGKRHVEEITCYALSLSRIFLFTKGHMAPFSSVAT